MLSCKRIVTYDSDGNNKKSYEVVFPRSADGIYYDCVDREFIPKINLDNLCTNKKTVDFITFDYEEAIKLRDKMTKEKVFNGLNLLLPVDPIDTFSKRCDEYMEKIEKYQQRLNKTEPIEQVKTKIKTPLK